MVGNMPLKHGILVRIEDPEQNILVLDLRFISRRLRIQVPQHELK